MKGEEVWITQSAECVETGEVWGMVEDKWCLIQGSSQKNLEKLIWKDSNQFFPDKKYEALLNQTIYEQPTTSVKSRGEIQKGDLIQFLKVQENQFGTVWGQTDIDGWVLLKSENNEYFKEKEDNSNFDSNMASSSTITLPILKKLEKKETTLVLQ